MQDSSVAVWIPGVLSLVGALLGVGLAHLLQARRDSSSASRARKELALRAIAAARAAQSFPTRVDDEWAPSSISPEDLQELERRVWLEGVERFFLLSFEARLAVAALLPERPDLEDLVLDDSVFRQHIDVAGSRVSQTPVRRRLFRSWG